MQRGDDHAAYKTSKRVELMKEMSPKRRHLGCRDGDAAKETKCNHDEGVKLGRNEQVGRQGGESLAEGYREDFSGEHGGELEPCAGGIRLETGHVVEGEKEGDGADDAVGHLGDDLGGGEDGGAVHFGGLLAEEEHAGNVVAEFDLAEDEGGEDGHLKDSKDAVLQRLARAVEVEIGEARHETEDKVVEEAGEEVVGRPPAGEVGPFDHNL